MAKTSTGGMLVNQTLSAVEIVQYIAPCIAIHVLTYDDAPLVVSRYDMRIAGPSIAIHRCIDVSLRP